MGESSLNPRKRITSAGYERRAEVSKASRMIRAVLECVTRPSELKAQRVYHLGLR